MTDERTCATCQHWTPNPDTHTGGCRELNNMHGNHLAYLTVVWPEGTDPLTAMLTPAMGSIVTRPEFGCLIWEAK